MESDSERTDDSHSRVPLSCTASDEQDCLTSAFVSIYSSSMGCLQSVYDILLQSFAQLFVLSKEAMCVDRPSLRKLDLLSSNNSAGRNSRRCRLRKNSGQKPIDEDATLLATKTRVTVRTISNLNVNRATTEQQSGTLGTINSHIVVTPVAAAQCQSRPPPDFPQPERIHSREQLADALCRRSYGPCMPMCCGHCRPMCPPSALPVGQMKQERDRSPTTPKLSDASDVLSTPYSASPSGTRLANDPNEQNQSIISFPDHDTSSSQRSALVDDEDDDNASQLRLDAQELVNDSIQTAQETYQRILRMSVEHNSPNDPAERKEVKTQSKSASVSERPRQKDPPPTSTLCQQLCEKLNLSDAGQITEILHVLASNAPHILKNPPETARVDNITKEKEHSSPSQLFLHPPFKPKRLIHLAADGSIQVLSAVDNSNADDPPSLHQQRYKMNYSNSAIVSKNPLARPDDSSLAVECETLTKQMCFNESSILSLQRRRTVIKSEFLLNRDASVAQGTSEELHEADPIVRIDLHSSEETIELPSENDENSLPEIVFKRIITPTGTAIHTSDPAPRVSFASDCHTDRANFSSARARQNHSRPSTSSAWKTFGDRISSS